MNCFLYAKLIRDFLALAVGAGIVTAFAKWPRVMFWPFYAPFGKYVYHECSTPFCAMSEDPFFKSRAWVPNLRLPGKRIGQVLLVLWLVLVCTFFIATVGVALYHRYWIC